MTLRYSLLFFIIFFCTNTFSASEDLSKQVVTQKIFTPPDTYKDTLLAPFQFPKWLLNTLIWPAKKSIEYAEEIDLTNRAKDFFSNEEQTIWLYPLVKFSNDQGVSWGVLFKNNHFLQRNKSITLDYHFYEYENYEGKFTYNGRFDSNSRFFYSATIEASSNPEREFFGIGKQANTFRKTLLDEERRDIHYRLGTTFKNMPFLSLYGSVGYSREKKRHSKKIEKDDDEDDHELPAEIVYPGLLLLGFDESLGFVEYGLTLKYDKSYPSAFPYTGQVIQLGILHGLSLNDNHFEYIKTHFKVSQFFDLFKNNRILVLGLNFRAVQGNGKTIPFYELPTLGKDELLRGFPIQRFRDRKAIVGNIEYRFPIWQAFVPNQTYGIAKTFLDVGHTFGDLSDMGRGKMYSSAGIGVALTSPNKFLTELEVAYGGEDVQFLLSFGRNL